MSDLITQLAVSLKRIRGFQVQSAGHEMLVTLPVSNGRKQAVKVIHCAGRHGPYNVLTCYSRACPAKDHRLIRAALERNGSNQLVSLVLNATVEPPAIDVSHSIVANGAQLTQEILNEFVVALQYVADVADAMEKAATGQDLF